MQRSFGLQISDLEPSESGVEQEITLEEAEKIVGGSGDKNYKVDKKPNNPPFIEPPGGGCVILNTKD